MKIPDSAAKALKLAIKVNTNIAGGGPKFKALLEKARSECRILSKPIDRAMKVRTRTIAHFVSHHCTTIPS